MSSQQCALAVCRAYHNFISIMSEAINALSKLHVVELRKGETTFDAKILRIERALKKVTDDNGNRVLARDENGNIVYDDRRRRIYFQREGADVVNDAFVLTAVFTNGEVPNIKDRKKGIDVTITMYLDDEDRPQFAAIDYNPGDSVILATEVADAIKTGALKYTMN